MSKVVFPRDLLPPSNTDGISSDLTSVKSNIKSMTIAFLTFLESESGERSNFLLFGWGVVDSGGRAMGPSLNPAGNWEVVLEQVGSDEFVNNRSI